MKNGQGVKKLDFVHISAFALLSERSTTDNLNRKTLESGLK
jgi:hypothetical protein